MPLAEQYACCAVSAFLKFAWAALSLTLALWFSNTRTATATVMPMITLFRCNTTNTSEIRLHALQTTGCTRGALRAGGGRLEWTKWIVSVDVVKEILPTQALPLPLLTGLGRAYPRKFSRSSCYSEFIGCFLGFLPHSTPRRSETTEGERPWRKSLWDSRCHWTALSPGRTMVHNHRWVTAVSDSSRGTPLATPNTGCRVPRWCSGSRCRAPSCFGRRTARWGRL